MIWRIVKGEGGQALVLVLAFMVLAVPLVTSSLRLATTLTIDSRTKNELLQSQYASLGAQEFALHLLLEGGETTTVIEIGGETFTTTITQLPPPPDLPPYLSSSFFWHKLETSKVANVTSTAPNSTTTYTVTATNRAGEDIDLTKVHDVLPLDFAYVPGSSQFYTTSESIISTANPTQANDELIWNIPKTNLAPGTTATMVFDATAAADDGVYCHEAFVRPGGRFTTSGKTAKITIGSPADQRCAGPVISITKTVEPEIASAGVETEFTYTITMTNEGTDDLKVRLILDTTSDDFEYVPFSVSSTPPSMVPGEPVTFPFWNTISWWFFGAGQTLATDTTWVLEFKGN